MQIPIGTFGPPRVTVVDADGAVRRVSVDSISAGFVVDEKTDGEPSVKQRDPGFTVDPSGRTAYVVGPDLLVAEVDLSSLAVSYHRVVTRTTQKSIEGPHRFAMWLGNGLLAVTGSDYAPGKDAAGKPVVKSTSFGLRIVDTHDWSSRTIDSVTNWVRFSGGMLIAQGDNHTLVAYGTDGRERWRTTIPDYSWMALGGDYGYVCDNGYLRRVVDVHTGATVASLPKASNRRCVNLLTR
jgi:hypothetical protein